MFNKQYEAVKAHLKKHKAAYISVVISAGFTYLIVRERHAGVPRVPDGLDIVTVRPLSFLSKQNVVTVIQRDGRGHPGYLVRCLETGDVYDSQADAAKQLGTTPSVVSGHLLGKLPDVFGLHLERIAA